MLLLFSIWKRGYLYIQKGASLIFNVVKKNFPGGSAPWPHHSVFLNIGWHFNACHDRACHDRGLETHTPSYSLVTLQGSHPVWPLCPCHTLFCPQRCDPGYSTVSNCLSYCFLDSIECYLQIGRTRRRKCSTSRIW